MEFTTVSGKRVSNRTGASPSARRAPRKTNRLRHDCRALSKQVLDVFRHPALWLSLAFLANVLEGALRKWVPGFGGGVLRNVAYFSKDFLMFTGVLLMMGRAWCSSPGMEELRKWGLPALGLIGFGGVLSLMGGFNAVGAALTLRAILVLPLLAYCYAGCFGGRFPLMGLAFLGVVLCVANGVLSLIQNSLPASDFLNKYAEDEMYVVELAIYGVRATGTYAYITGLGVASAIGLWSGMVMISLSHSRWQMVWGVVGILGGFACAFASISRGTVVTAFAMLGLWALTSVRASRMLARGILVAGAVGLALMLLAPSLAERFMHVGEGTFDRFESAGDDNLQRAVGQLPEMWQALSQTPFGNGLGTEQVGGNVATKGVAGFTTYESQFPRIVAELGIPGFLGFLVMVVAVIVSLQRTKHGPGGARWDMVITATQVYLLGQFYTSLVFNHTASAFVWMTVAAVFAAEPIRHGKQRRRARKASGKQDQETSNSRPITSDFPMTGR